MDNNVIDVLVIGGGAAGLSAAVTLGRARRSVTVVDAGEPRNARASGVHGFLTRDGISPAELVEIGRAEAEGYGARFVRGTVTTAVRDDDGVFAATLDSGDVVRARRLLVATGLVDELPDVEGVAERWGRDVVHCPYCHGWEVRDQAIGVLATGPLAVHSAHLFRQLSADVVVFRHTSAPLSAEQAEQLAARGITVVEGEVAGLEVVDDRLTGVRLASGEVVARQVLVVASQVRANAGVVEALGLKAVDWEMAGHVFGQHIPADASGATEIPGVFVAGNAADPRAQVVAAAAAGVLTGAAVNSDLITEDTAAAVAALRAEAAPTSEEFWEARYGSNNRVWSGRANPVLVDVAEPLPPGRALDLGCGEGGDALWLAGRGWRVTAVDVSGTALKRAEAHTADAGLVVDFQRHDLAETFPEGTFDLVSAQYFQSPVDFPRTEVLRTAAAAVTSGGLFLLVDHGSAAPWSWNQNGVFPSPEELFATLDLDPELWRVERLHSPTRQATGPNGETATVADTVVAVRRR
ncbi:FAD-dependent oxidoreductase [Umezawaea sp. NPDC059074]|uniref:FAD-dependent oxidoreductase n=1 Tax=Umezawaea sp. NPDC059074 TaxID=3346716 RepID=UPI0036870603